MTRGRAGGAGSVVALVTGLFFLLPGLGLVAFGGTALALDVQRDANGWTTSSARTMSSPTAVLTVEDVELQIDPVAAAWLSSQDFSTLRIRATAADGGAAFLGIAPQSALDPWLEGIEHDQIQQLRAWSVAYQRHDGAPSAGLPSGRDFWVASVEGAGPQELTWPVTDGRWGLVLANPDGTRGVDVVVDVGVRLPSLAPVAIPSLAAGTVLLVLAAALVLVGAAGLGGQAPPAGGPGADGAVPYPPAPPVPPQQTRPTSPPHMSVPLRSGASFPHSPP